MKNPMAVVLGCVLASIVSTVARAQTPDPGLLARAQAYDSEFRDRHVPGFGGVVNVVYDSETFENVLFYMGQGDSTMWTSTYGVTQAYRYAVTGEEEAKQNAIAAVQTLEKHLRVTGRTGYLGRYVGPLSDPAFWFDVYSLNEFRYGEGIWLGDFWLSNSSSDQHVGFFFAMAMIYDLVDDGPTRTLIASMVKEVYDALHDQGWFIITEEGQPSTAAPNISGSERLMFALTAAHILNTQEYWDLYEQLYNLEKPTLLLSSWALFNRYTEYFAMNLRHDNYLVLFRLEPDPDRLAYLFDVYKRVVLPYVEDGHQTYYDYVYLTGCERLGNCEGSLAKMEDGVEQLHEFPDWPNNEIWRDPGPPPGGIDPLSQTLSDIADSLPDWLVELTGLDFEPQALEGYPVGTRCVTDYLWQRSPHLMTCNLAVTSKLFPGSDYLLAYWMGRYTNYLNPRDIDGQPPDDDTDDDADDDADDDTADDDLDDDVGDDDTDDDADDDSDDDSTDDSASSDDDDGGGCGC